MDEVTERQDLGQWNWPVGSDGVEFSGVPEVPGKELLKPKGREVQGREVTRPESGRDAIDISDAIDTGKERVLDPASVEAAGTKSSLDAPHVVVDPDKLLGSTGNLRHTLETGLPPGIEPSDVIDPGSKAREQALREQRERTS